MGKIYTADNFVKSGSTGSQILAANGDVITAGTNITISGGLISTSVTNVSIGTNANGLSVSGSSVLELALSSASATGALSSTDYQFFYNKQNALTNPVTGTGDVNKLPKFTGSGTIGSSIITDSGAIVDILANSSASIDTRLSVSSTGNGGAGRGTAILMKVPGSSSSANGVKINAYTVGGAVTAQSTDLAFDVGLSGTLVERMRITSGGNVGIGTASPFTVTNQTSLTLDGVNASRLDMFSGGVRRAGFYADSGISNLGSVTAIPLTFSTSNTERMRITSGGSVGIGTTSPNSRLHVVSAVGGAGNTLPTNATAIFDQTGNNLISISGGSANEAGIFMPRGTAAYYSGVFRSDTNLLFRNNDAEAMRITSGGNVGIGTPSPTNFVPFGYGVNVEASGGRGGGFVSSNSDSTVKMVMHVDGSAGLGQLKTLTNHALMFATNDTERMRITSGGNVGIGTTSPSAKLQVYSGASVTDYITFNVGDGSNTLSYIPYVATGDYNSLSYGGGSLLFNTAGSRLTIGTQNGTAIQFGPTNTLISGNVGIGTSSPSTKLDVVGAITASGGFFNSDMRLKDLTDYDYNVSDIKPITYLWKDGRDNKKHVGYSAQEVQKVMPDAVNEGTDGMLSVNYVEILVAKISQMEKEIAYLKSKI